MCFDGAPTDTSSSICACISLITFFTMPGAFIYILFYFLIGRRKLSHSPGNAMLMHQYSILEFAHGYA